MYVTTYIFRSDDYKRYITVKFKHLEKCWNLITNDNK